jgi:hypothetical protein
MISNKCNKRSVKCVVVALLGICLCTPAFAFLDFGGRKDDKKSDVHVVVWT